MIILTGAAALLLSIGLLCARRIDTAVRLCALQAVFAAASLGEAAPAPALLAVALNGVALPVALARSNGATLLTPRGGPVVSWAAAFALLSVTIAVFADAGTGGMAVVGVSVALLGLLLFLVRSHALAPALGLLSSQNGLVLVAGAHPHMSLPAAVAVAVPLVPALVLADNCLRR
jgi:hypothetical protein